MSRPRPYPWLPVNCLIAEDLRFLQAKDRMPDGFDCFDDPQEAVLLAASIKVQTYANRHGIRTFDDLDQLARVSGVQVAVLERMIEGDYILTKHKGGKNKSHIRVFVPRSGNQALTGTDDDESDEDDDESDRSRIGSDRSRIASDRSGIGAGSSGEFDGPEKNRGVRSDEPEKSSSDQTPPVGSPTPTSEPKGSSSSTTADRRKRSKQGTQEATTPSEDDHLPPRDRERISELKSELRTLDLSEPDDTDREREICLELHAIRTGQGSRPAPQLTDSTVHTRTIGTPTLATA